MVDEGSFCQHWQPMLLQCCSCCLALGATLSERMAALAPWGHLAHALTGAAAIATDLRLGYLNMACAPVERWGITGQQADAAEFVQYLLSFTQAINVSWQWEKRQYEDDLLMITGTTHVDLIHLQFLITHVNSPRDLTVTDLLDHWSQEEGPRQGLVPTEAPKLVALHLERGVQDAHGTILKCTKIAQFETGVDVPHFMQPGGLDMDWITMKPIAVVCHLGENQCSGHYRSAIRFESGPNQQAWLLTEDNMPPTRADRLPRWFLQNVCIIWLAVDGDMILPKDCQADVSFRWRDDMGVPPFGMLPQIPAHWRVGS